MIVALTLAAVLSGQAAPPAAPSPPQVRRDVRIVQFGGPHGGSAGGPQGGPPAGPLRLDRDGDGFISRDEYVGPSQEAFRVLDRDGDGRISTDELVEGRRTARLILGGPGDPGGPGGPGDPGPMAGHGPGGPGGAMNFTLGRHGGQDGPPPPMFPGGLPDGDGPGNLDKDGDGKVSQEEFMAPLRDAFRRMDRDGSGALEAGEQGPGANVHVFTRRVDRPAD